MLADDPWIHVCDHPQCSGNIPGHTGTTQGSPGRLKDAPNGFKDLAETRGCKGLTLDHIKITLQVSSWDLVTTGYLNPNG